MAVERGMVGGLPPVRRRASLPNGRAVVGGLLVAVSAVGIYGVQYAATAPPRTLYAVAAHPLVAGRELGEDDVALAPAELPDLAEASAFRDPAPLFGRVLTTNLGDGELIQASAIGPVRAVGSGEREVSFTAEPARSLGDRIIPGDVIDVLATYGDAGASRTEAVALYARVIDRQERGGGFIFTVVVSRPEDVLRLASAAASGALTLVRSTTAAMTGDTTPYPATVTAR